MTPSAKSLVLDLLSTARGHTMPVRALVLAGALFGLSGNSVRVALARLCTRGRVERDERGRYRLSADARAVQQHVAAWSQLEQRVVPWRGGWIGVHTAGSRPLRGAPLRRRRRALDFLGLRALASDLWIRPDNLAGGVSDLRQRLYGLGLPADTPIFSMRDLDSESEARVRGLWEVRALCRGYRQGHDALRQSAKRLRRLTRERALVESFQVGGRALRQLAFDPLLPESIVPAAPRREFVDELRRYDRIGRAYWRSFMEGQGVPDLASPLRVHMIDLGEPQPAAAGSQP